MTKKISTPTVTTQAYPKISDTRLEQLRYALEDYKVDALVITHLPNIRYITNFSGSAATLIITENEIHFVTDDRYEEQIKTELYALPNLYTHITRDVWKLIHDRKVIKSVSSLIFESDHLSYSDAVSKRNQIRPLKFKPAPNLVEPYTMPKAPEELAHIKKACEIAEQTYEKILQFVKPGMTEKEISIEIAYQARKFGSEGDAFDIICVSGERGAVIHGKPSDKKIKKNELILLDFGCIVNGFRSDISRTFCVGKPTKEQKDIYKVVYEAKEAVINAIRPAINGKSLDAIARNMITKAGFEPYIHGLGHGIGIEAHEIPFLTFRFDDQIIPDLSVLAIEPGVYIPNKLGIRIEDVCQATRNGGVHLTNAPNSLVCV